MSTEPTYPSSQRTLPHSLVPRDVYSNGIICPQEMKDAGNRLGLFWAGDFGVQGTYGEGQARGSAELGLAAWVLVLRLLALPRAVLTAGVIHLCPQCSPHHCTTLNCPQVDTIHMDLVSYSISRKLAWASSLCRLGGFR